MGSPLLGEDVVNHCVIDSKKHGGGTGDIKLVFFCRWDKSCDRGKSIIYVQIISFMVSIQEYGTESYGFSGHLIKVLQDKLKNGIAVSYCRVVVFSQLPRNGEHADFNA